MPQNNSPSRNPAVDIEAIWYSVFASPVAPTKFTPPLGITPLFATMTPAFNANLTPDPSQGAIWAMGALTGAVAVAAPVRADATPIQAGCMLMFKWTQDGTGGRVVTYNAIFKTGGAVAVATTLSTITLDWFFYDGTNWRIWNRITGQAI